MEGAWFRPWGWVYRPIAIPGVLAVLAALAFCGNVFWAIDRQSHSVADTLYGVFPYFACTFLLLDWLAAKSSARSA